MATVPSSRPPPPSPGGSTRDRIGGSSNTREGSARTMVADQISQAILSTSNLLHLMLQSSPSQAHLIKLPKNLLAKASTIKNTEHVLEHLPRVISSLDAHMDNGLQSVTHLKTVTQLLTNIESCQLKSISKAQLSSEDPEPVYNPPEAGLHERFSLVVGVQAEVESQYSRSKINV